MACGHREISRVALHCPPETALARFYIQFEELAASEIHICGKICRSFDESDIQKTEVCSGEMCGPCQVATGEILDSLVRDLDAAEVSDDQQWMMSGGIDADMINLDPENAVDDLVNDAGGYQMNGTTHDEYMISDGIALDVPVHTTEDNFAELLHKNSRYEKQEAEDQFEEEFLRNMSNPGDTLRKTECSGCKRFKRRNTLINFQDYRTSLSAHDPSAASYAGRMRPIFTRLRSDGTAWDEEGGLLGRLGWVCCDKCGTQMHLL
jgi:hypothetical protein